jgi:hypothetical protein
MTTPMANLNQITVAGPVSRKAIFVAMNDAPHAVTEKSASKYATMFFFKSSLSGTSQSRPIIFASPPSCGYNCAVRRN